MVGGLLLVFGLQWLRKAILRASGWKAVRDEASVFERERAEAASAPHEERAGLDWYGFTICFKAVLLEGLEVAFIVLTFGSTQGSIPLAVVGAAAAVILVVLAGILVREPLSRVPENTLAFAVGVMLTTFGIFWGAEGAGVDWPGGDASLPAVLAFVLLDLARLRHDAASAEACVRMKRFAKFWWDFIVGDDWRVAVGVLLAFGVTALLATTSVPAWWVLPLAVAAVLWLSLLRAAR